MGKFGQILISKKNRLRQFLTPTRLDFMERTKKDTELERNTFYVQNYKETDEQDLIDQLPLKMCKHMYRLQTQQHSSYNYNKL